MDPRLIPQLARVFRHRHRSVGHVRCVMDNMGDQLLGEAITELLDRLVVVDYSRSRAIALATNLSPRRQLFRFTCLGGGTLIFADLNRTWGAALQHALQNTEALFSIGTGVIDPDFRAELHTQHGLRPLQSDSIARWVDLLHQFKLVSVRGPDSARMLRERGLPNVEVIGDPTLFYARQQITPKAGERRIGISISNTSYFFGNVNHRVVEHFTDLLKRLRAARWQVTLYPMGPEDQAATNDLLAAVADPDIRVHRWHRRLPALLADIATQDVLVGVRLHSVAAAVCTYTPAIMVAYQPKNVEFMRSLGMEDHCVRIDRFDVDEVAALIEHLYENGPAVQERQFAACRSLKQKLELYRDRIYELTGSGTVTV